MTTSRARRRVNRVVVRVVVVVGTATAAVGLYLVSLPALDAWRGTTDADRALVSAPVIVVVALVALAAVPIRYRLEAWASRRVYGDSGSPEAALHTFATRMSRSVPLDELLRQLAETLRTSMGLHRAEVWTGHDRGFDLAVAVPHREASRLHLGQEEHRVALRTPAAGNAWLTVWAPELLTDRVDRIVRVAPVAHRGELLGLIVAERDADGDEFGDDDDLVLTDIARRLGLALHNVRLDTALQASLNELQVRNAELAGSRARIVAAADESRRQIERNLHDGVQQHLVALAVKLGLTRQLLDTDPTAAVELVDELRHDTQVTLDELRELAHGIYPPLLRGSGLPQALAAAANRAVLPTTVTVSTTDRFEPEVEAAVYFCCVEAIQNAGKHAGDRAAVIVRVTQDDDDLCFEVTDNGRGFDPTNVVKGAGFVNMADRLGAMAGTLTVTGQPGRGTTITGRLPAPPRRG